MIFESSMFNQVGQMVLEGKAQSTSETMVSRTTSTSRSCGNIRVCRNPVLLCLGCLFLLLNGICETISFHPPPPATPPSLALSDSVLIAAIKLPHLVKGEILIFVRPREELKFFLLFPPFSLLPPLSSGAGPASVGSCVICLCRCISGGSLLCLSPSASLHLSVARCN